MILTQENVNRTDLVQGFNLLARTTALENVELPCLYGKQRMSSKNMRERAMHCLDIVGLSNRADHMPNQLSGGQQQRVAIARALANNPPIILADEPCASLDAATAREVMAAFLAVCRQDGKTLLLVSHEQAALGDADQIIDMAELNRAETGKATTATVRQ